MNVQFYVALVTLVGFAIAYFLGRAMNELTGIAAVMVFLIVSVVLGLLLAFGVPGIVGGLCSLLGVAENDCIRTDDQTVWDLATPLLAFPAYMLSMFFGRAWPKPAGRNS
jgi:hypothetical protein